MNNSGLKNYGINNQGKVANFMFVDQEKMKIKGVGFGAAASKFASLFQVKKKNILTLFCNKKFLYERFLPLKYFLPFKKNFSNERVSLT